jgi:iron complex outermembrane recepter protein
MSAYLRFIAVVLLFPVLTFASVVRGVVRAPDGAAVSGALVTSGAASVQTASDGTFTIEVADESVPIRVSHPAYTAVELEPARVALGVTLVPAFAETLEVSGIRADEKTPVTKSNISRDEIVARYYGQDLPMLMRDTPSVNAYAESGFGASGYSYITLRGVTPSRINYTLDGVPLADSEDMGTYFVDFPDLARSLQSVQIQRGVGTSTVGSPSFGGSVNLQSIDVSTERSASAELTLGSFGTRAATVAMQSGQLGAGFSAYGRLSVLDTDGFRDNSSTKQHNLFFSAVKQNEGSQLKLTGFSGREEQQLSFYAADEETLKTNLRANPLAPEETDAFSYDLAQLQYLKPLAGGADLAASVYYQRGYGAYRMFDDNVAKVNLRAYGLDGMLLGSLVTYSRTDGAWSTNGGVHVNRFQREHTSDLVGGPRDYFNEGTKQEANAFVKLSHESNGWNAFTDLQVRRASFDYEGDVDIRPVSWTFFNPRVGLRRTLRAGNAMYVSAGLSRREPARSDMFLGEDNPTASHDLRAVKPERLLDLEAGWDFATPTLALAANVYSMEFRNEIAATGELTELGLPIRRNVDRSSRRGVELDLTWRPTSMIRTRSTANLSRNRIGSWTQYFDVYDESGAYADSQAVTYRDVVPVLSPAYILNQSIDFMPMQDASFGFTGRWVGRSYLDNTENTQFSAPSFFTLEAHGALSLERWIHAGSPRLTLQVNNVLNDRRIYGSGYSYQYAVRDGSGNDQFGGTNYFFPQATRHAILKIEFRL